MWSTGLLRKAAIIGGGLSGFLVVCCVLVLIIAPRQPQPLAPTGAIVEVVPTASATIRPTHTPAPTISPQPTRTPRPPTPTAAPPISHVVNVGNLRSEPRIAADTVMARICPNDTVAVVSRAIIGDASWYRVRIETTAADCDPRRATVGMQGWVAGGLLGEPSYAFDIYAETARLLLPTPVRWTPTPRPTATDRPISSAAPAIPSGVASSALPSDRMLISHLALFSATPVWYARQTWSERYTVWLSS
jgi:hypothetical protein